MVSLVGMAGDDNHTCLVGELCELINRFWNDGKRVPTRATPSVNVLSEREAASSAARRRVVKTQCGVCVFVVLSVRRVWARKRGVEPWCRRRKRSNSKEGDKRRKPEKCVT